MLNSRRVWTCLGQKCRGCQGEAPYDHDSGRQTASDADSPCVTVLSAEQATGQKALHDMISIVPDVFKGTAIAAGQRIGLEDVERLHSGTARLSPRILPWPLSASSRSFLKKALMKRRFHSLSARSFPCCRTVTPLEKLVESVKRGALQAISYPEIFYPPSWCDIFVFYWSACRQRFFQASRTQSEARVSVP
jgi:hypothetical protein